MGFAKIASSRLGRTEIACDNSGEVGRVVTMSDESKLGLIAGVLAVVAVAVFSHTQSPGTAGPPKPVVAGTASAPPSLPPAAVVPAK